MNLTNALLLIFWSCMLNAANYTFGYVPISFPRDPVEFNQFDEHVVIGQILETLVDADGDGKLVPAVAKQWHFSANGKEIIFNIDSEVKFSDGKNVKSEDVVYSIKRHLKSNSQSKYFLADIEDIKVTKKDEVTIFLKASNTSILKALTRDQLGIVPDGWTFNSQIANPFIGTGPYNLIKKNNDWFLESNKHYKRFSVPIAKWKLIFFKDSKMAMPDDIPSVVPVATAGALDLIKKSPLFLDKAYTISPILGFTQTSFWTHPKGQLYHDKKLRIKAQSLLNEMIEEFCKSNSLQRSTGLIPTGVQGSLDTTVKIDPMSKLGSLKKLKIASLAGNFAKLFSPENIEKIKHKYGISIEMKFFTFVEMAAIQDFEPDIITGSWAGGFNDPAGFLALLGPLLGEDFKKYLGADLSAILSSAESEQDFTKRSNNFKKIGHDIIAEGLLTPGWRVNAFELKDHLLTNKQYQTRYTPRLINYLSAE